jgi:predicted RNase H-like HicB family nuclease
MSNMAANKRKCDDIYKNLNNLTQEKSEVIDSKIQAIGEALIKFTYLAVFEPSEKGCRVYFTDLPGCVSYGENFEEALGKAAEALYLHISGLDKDGNDIPAPSENPEVDPATSTGYIIVPVTITFDWDSDFTKLTPAERESLDKARKEIENGEIVDHTEIDWS